MGRMIRMIDRRCAFLSPAGPFCGAYAIRPYPDGRKMIAFGACSVVLPQRQAAFGGCYGVGGGKCGAFSCPRVGAYCIRPTNVPFMGRMIRMIDRRCAFLSPAGPFCGAYAIRPYPDGQKMIAVRVCSAVGYEKRGAMPTSYCLTWRRSYTCDLFYLGAWGLTPDCKDQIFGAVSLRNIQDQAIIQPNLLPDDYARLAEKIGLENISMTISPIQKSRCDRVFWGNI